jgi:hypothetical protein
MTSKKKFPLAIALFLCVNGFVARAQETTSELPTYNNEWGLNVTGFANQFLSFNGNDAPSGPYLMTYKRINGNKAFRMGFGINVNTVDGTTGNSSVPFKQTQFGFDLRLGSEKHHEIYRRWLFTTGLDGLLGYGYSKFNSNNNFNSGEQKSNVLKIGLGPVLGIHYRINNRISVGTESTVYLNYTFAKNKFSDGFEGFEGKSETSNFQLNIAPPLALYLSLRI